MADFKSLTREQLRVKLKEFENDFIEKNKRKPAKEDIKKRTNICSMYAWYHNMTQQTPSASKVEPKKKITKVQPQKLPENASQPLLTRMKRPSQESPQKSRSLKRWKSSAPSSHGVDFDSPSKFVLAPIGGIKQVPKKTVPTFYMKSPEKSPVKPLIRRSSSFSLPAMEEEEIDRMLGLSNSSPISFSSDDSGLDSPQSDSNSQIIWSDLAPKADQNMRPFKRGYVNNTGGNFKRIDLKHKHFAKGKPGARGANLRRQVLLKKGKEVVQCLKKNGQNETSPSPVVTPCKINKFDFGGFSFEKEEIMSGLKKFGFDAFNIGQEQTIERILEGKGTVFVARTGSGKSLCYQLPAYLLSQLKESPSCVLVISPLIALIEDQINQLPDFLNGVSLHSGQTEKEAYQIRMTLRDTQPDIVFLSPERLLFYLDQLLRQHLLVDCFLGLTATLSRREVEGVMTALQLTNADDPLINCFDMPTNQSIVVLEDIDRDESLVKLIQTKLMKHLPIIVYCNRREEAERVAMRIRIGCSRNEAVLGKNLKNVVAYHAGLDSRKLGSLRKQFAAGKVSILVATEAFSLGINKMDLGAVILYNMPSSWESVVQKFGRAGRDGEPCFGFIFLDSGRKDERELIKQMYSDYCPDSVIKNLVSYVFPNLKQQTQTGIDYVERMVPVDKIVSELDLKEEVLITLFTYLELLDPACVQYLGRFPRECTVRMSSAKALNALVAGRDYLKEIETLPNVRDNAMTSHMKIQADVAAAHLKTSYFELARNLDSLRVFSGAGKCTIDWNNSEQYFLLKCRTDIKADTLDGMTDQLINTVRCRLRGSLNAMTNMRKLLAEQSSISVTKMDRTEQCELDKRSDRVKECIMEYFDQTQTNLCQNPAEESQMCVSEEQETELRTDVRMFRSVYSCDHPDLTALNVARIFYGIQSPNFPAQTWGKVRQYWRKYVELMDFRALLKIVLQEFTN